MNLHASFPPVLMSENMAAYYLSISPRTLRELQAKSLIIPKKLGGKRGFLRSDLDEFAQSLPDWERS